MSVKVISGIAGSVTTIGGVGIGIYLLNNRNKTQTEKEWKDLLNQNPEYIAVKETGKIVNFVTYKENETVDNNANYFLMEITSRVPKDTAFSSNFSKLEMYIDDNIVLNETGLSDKNFPLFCFQDDNVDKIENLNLNSLKKFSHDCSKKYILASFRNTSGKSHSYLKDISLNDWNKPNIPVKINFVRQYAQDTYHGKMLKIFHKHYQPTIAN